MPINNATLPGREDYLRKKRNKTILKYFLIFLFFISLIALSSYISHRKEIRISEVSLRGGVLITQDEISEKVFEYMKGSHFWLYPKNNAIWYQKKGLEKYLKESFQRIDTVNIYIEGFRTMIINVEERKPFAIWCDTLPNQNKVSTTTMMEDGSLPGNCYFMDQNSAIFSESPHFSGDAYFKYYGMIATDKPIGLYYISSSTKFQEISTFIELVRGISIKPLYLVAKGDNDFSLHISGGGQIFFDLKKPLSEVAQNLVSLLRTPALSTSTNKDLPVDYIDLRYGNKLFYKLKGE